MGTDKNLITPVFLLLWVLTVMTSCSVQQAASPQEPSGELATVIDYRELDGCEFLIELQDGTKLQPVKLDERFRKDKLKVWITWKKYQGAGICMAGTMVELTSIAIAK